MTAWYVGVFVVSIAALVVFAMPVLRGAYDRGRPDVAVRVSDRAGRMLYERGDTTQRMSVEEAGSVHVEYGARPAPWRSVLGELRPGALALAAGALLLAVVGGYMLTQRGLQPVRELAATARRVVESGDLAQRVPVRGTRDELDEVSLLVNRMLDHNQRLVTGMRDALDNVAHDLRTPLTRIRGAAELALRGDDAAAREALADTIEESERVLVMLRALMDISEAETGIMQLHRERVGLDRIAREVGELYGHVAEEAGIALRVDAEPVFAQADAMRVRQAIGNLVDNAIKYTPRGGTVTLRVAREGDAAVVSVADTGAGIPEEALPRIWDRLYRAEASRSKPGLGLGLSLVRAIAKAHAAEATVDSAPGRGARFVLRFAAA
ncbi:MAG TPA: HAMP domain-containing sensor histidine kinase [Kofleriaceae bacterium]|nr:HAMP domain-containing sensor histidine kinase [Kofleriaceae bacterium]